MVKSYSTMDTKLGDLKKTVDLQDTTDKTLQANDDAMKTDYDDKIKNLKTK